MINHFTHLRDGTDLLHFVKSLCRYLNNAHRVAIFILRNKVEAVSVRAVNGLFTYLARKYLWNYWIINKIQKTYVWLEGRVPAGNTVSSWLLPHSVERSPRPIKSADFL